MCNEYTAYNEFKCCKWNPDTIVTIKNWFNPGLAKVRTSCVFFFSLTLAYDQFYIYSWTSPQDAHPWTLENSGHYKEETVVWRFKQRVNVWIWYGLTWNSENNRRGLYFTKALFEGLIFGGAYLRREICVSKSIGLAYSWKEIYRFWFV